MKIYKDLNVIVVKDKKLDSFKTYKVWFLIFFILSLSSITAFTFKKSFKFFIKLYFRIKKFKIYCFKKVSILSIKSSFL